MHNVANCQPGAIRESCHMADWHELPHKGVREGSTNSTTADDQELAKLGAEYRLAG